MAAQRSAFYPYNIMCNLVLSLLISTLIFRMSDGFPVGSNRRLRQSRLYLSSSSDANFMASLNSRIQKVREDRLPLVVVDTMLPRQVLTLKVENESLLRLLHERMSNETPIIGITGIARLKTGQKVFLKHGVEAEITYLEAPSTADPSGRKLFTVQFTGQRRFTIDPDSIRSVESWTEAAVQFLSNMDDESLLSSQDAKLSLAHAMWQSQSLQTLCYDEWIPLARQNERFPGQIDQLLEQLGPMPSSNHPTDRAFWVGALINPLPALGVAMELRPSLLAATSAQDRVEIVANGVEASIRYMKRKLQTSGGDTTEK